MSGIATSAYDSVRAISVVLKGGDGRLAVLSQPVHFDSAVGAASSFGCERFEIIAAWHRFAVSLRSTAHLSEAVVFGAKVLMALAAKSWSGAN